MDISTALYFEHFEWVLGQALILRQLSIALDAEEAEGFEDPTCISGLAEKRGENRMRKEERRDRHVEWEPLGHSLRDTSEEVPKCLCF